MEKTTTKRNKRIPRGLRNCNPLNIRMGASNWVGQCGNDGAFVKFVDVKHGLRAAFRLLFSYYNKYACCNIASIVKRWAPPNENNTIAYIKKVCNYSGLSTYELLKVHLQKEKACKLVSAMAFVELGGDYLSKSVISEAWDMAFPLPFKN